MVSSLTRLKVTQQKLSFKFKIVHINQYIHMHIHQLTLCH